MKRLLPLIIALAAVLVTACNGNKTPENMDNSKKLVLYYSQTHATEEMAKYIQQQLDCDIETIELTEPYDPDYDSTIARGLRELQNEEWPEIQPLKSKVEDYDVIFLGYPIWFSTYANPIASLLKTVDLKGKKVVPFATFGSGGLRPSIENLKKNAPGVDVIGSIGCRRALMEMMPEAVDDVLVGLGYKEGKFTEPVPYTEQQPVTAEQKEIFTKAVGDYPMLKATPLTCGQTESKHGTDYLFIAENRHDGASSNVEVYITVEKDGKSYFTLVEKAE